MYVPKFNEEKDTSVLQALVKLNPLGAWATIVDGEIEINHIPFILHESKGEFGTLVGHVARSNDIFRGYSKDVNSVVVFQGEQAYITPSWYPSKREHGKVVPTWNYTVVHAYGIPRVIEDPQWLLQHLNELTNIHESEQDQPWRVSDAPDDFIEKLAHAVVGIEIPISKLVGKFKLGQNRPEADQLGIIEGLAQSDNAQAGALADQLSKSVSLNTKNK